nr:PREDICTED: protein transport protein SEC31-like [Musa acuminata subsp. malaccensis]
MASSSLPFASGPPRPRPGFAPSANANVAGAPPQFASRPPTAAFPQGLVASNGPQGLAAPRIPSPPHAQQTPPFGAPASVRAPSPSAAPSQAHAVRLFLGNPPAAAPVAAAASRTFTSPPASLQFGRPPMSHPLSGWPTSQPPFSGSQPALAGPPTTQLPFNRPPTSHQPSTQQTFTRPPVSQPYMGSSTSQPYAGRPSSIFRHYSSSLADELLLQKTEQMDSFGI